ncbi:Na+/H+ antiporter NhaA [Candidatus Symbiobacter mobilis]|uniref:Na(+)/H(+) antiporter NhaA n=1 Tax=Candidatus Symbiobacter mobilis CR TaxID=946483 RepID=U5NCQ7_9BURK|nr:Na+/H+ antiporter NhaA [Candidatus Symbiobacter mobilis]AGX88018.1 NhaA family sodium:proton antiporter [Candidatus Symbiobacter mobilis CR]
MAKLVIRRRFLPEHFTHESAGGVVLAVAALAALVASNSALGGWYQALVHLHAEVVFGDRALVLSKSLLHWVNDLWMAVFFFQVGLEIKREFLEGELSGPGQLLLPATAALGGMAMPALWYTMINWGDAAALRGWAIPAATDIAFALGVVALLGSRVPPSLKVFLTAVAIIDDLGAIVVIALFYTSSLSWPMLGGAFVACGVLWGLHRLRVCRVDVYALVGLVLWFFVLQSGVHATLAGVLTALAIPMRTASGGKVLEQVEHDLRPWVAFAILPVFAFVNAGVALQGVTWQTLLSPVPLGIGLGLVLGKTLGVFGASLLLIRMGWVPQPTGTTTLQLFGIGVLCGMGFTMSLFIGGLAFGGLDPLYTLELKLGVLCGSLTAGVLGSVLLGYRPRK